MLIADLHFTIFGTICGNFMQ